MTKRITAFAIVATLLFSIFSLPIYASDSELDLTGAKFEFVETSANKRIDENGDFTYAFMNAVISDYFKPTRTSITITSITSTETGAWFSITLFEANTGDKIGSLSCKDDGMEDSKTFTGLTVGQNYYFEITKTNPLNSAWVEGYGHVTNIE